MKKQTVMHELKWKLQVAIGEMNGELSSYESGYKQCLINIQNDIDLQMMAMEKEQIIHAYEIGFADAWDDARYDNEPKYSGAEQYYNETYGKD